MLLTIVAAVNSSFFMGAFFLLSGYFTPGSYYRKGSFVYLRDRFIRLGIPIILFVVFVAPFIYSFQAVMVFDIETPLIDFYLQQLESRAYFGIGPLWFLQALLIFAILYVIIQEFYERLYKAKFSPQNKSRVNTEEFPRNEQIFLVIFILGVSTFVIRLFIPSDTPVYNLPLGDFAQYTFMFVLGILAYQKSWFAKITDSDGRFWMKVTLGSIVFLIVFAIVTGAFEGDTSVFQGGFTWQSMLGSFWSSLMCVSICISLISFYKSKLNKDNRYAKIFSQNAYTVYIIHAPVVVVTSISLASIILHPLLKFVFILCLALSLCFIISHFFLRRIPASKRVLG